MEQLNRKIQDDDVGIDNDVGHYINTRAPNNAYHDMRAAPRRHSGVSAFANIVRNKSAPLGLNANIKKEISIPSEIYTEKYTLESFDSGLTVFQDFLLDVKSLAKVKSKDCSGFLTISDYCKKLSTDNEKYKYR
jgi:hypothetical protein